MDKKHNPAWENLENFLVEGDMKYFEMYKRESDFDNRYNNQKMEEGPSQ